MIEVNGMAHVILTVSQWDKAHAFYGELLPFLGLTKVYDGNNFLYHVGGRTAVGIQPCDPAFADERFVQRRVGLHHLCLRARSREDVDRCAALLKEIGATIVRGPLEGDWAPGYLLCPVRRPGRHPARGEFRAGRRGAGRGRIVQSIAGIPLTPISSDM